jgi:hypothetical protein
MMKPSEWLQSRFEQLTIANGIGMSPSRAKWQAVQEWLDQYTADNSGKCDPGENAQPDDPSNPEEGPWFDEEPDDAPCEAVRLNGVDDTCVCGEAFSAHKVATGPEHSPVSPECAEEISSGKYTATRDPNSRHKWPLAGPTSAGFWRDKLPDHHNEFGEAWWIDHDVPQAEWKCVFSPKDA